MTTSNEPIVVDVAFGDSGSGSGSIRLLTDANRGATISARLSRPGVVRDALLAIGDTLASDLRRKPNDRADYLAYLIQRGKGVGKQVWDAQKEFLAMQYSAATAQLAGLDPVLTITDDAVRFEAMSRDQSTYAQLVLKRPAALLEERSAKTATGTTYVQLDGAAFTRIAQIRSFRPTVLELQPGASGNREQRAVPLPWLRAFGQMQAAALLATTKFELSAVDLYNVLHTLRMKKAKTAPRGLRYELVPGEAPRLVLEPWDLVLHGTSGPYRGSAPRILRTWGRNRLNVLARVLPHARSVTVSIAGPGLPAFYAVDLGDATLSLALSGWTDAGWAGIATFDLLAAAPDSPLAALTQLREGVDIAAGTRFARPLVASIPAGALTYGSPREAAAHRLLEQPGAVTITKLHDKGADGRTIEGQVIDAAAHRTFYPAFTIDRESRTGSASCTCPAFRRSGIKEGPCEHMIALRVQLARDQAKHDAARLTPEGRAQITAETRTLVRRSAKTQIAETIAISLDGRTVTTKHDARHQRLRFDDLPAARAAYFARLEELATKGYLDATGD